MSQHPPGLRPILDPEPEASQPVNPSSDGVEGVNLSPGCLLSFLRLFLQSHAVWCLSDLILALGVWTLSQTEPQPRSSATLFPTHFSPRLIADMADARARLGDDISLQGNLDPVLLFASHVSVCIHVPVNRVAKVDRVLVAGSCRGSRQGLPISASPHPDRRLALTDESWA